MINVIITKWEKEWRDREQQKFRQTKHHTQTKHLDVYHFKSKWILKKEREMFEWIKKDGKRSTVPILSYEWMSEEEKNDVKKTKQNKKIKPNLPVVMLVAVVVFDHHNRKIVQQAFFSVVLFVDFFSIFLLWFDLIWLFGMRAMWFSHF